MTGIIKILLLWFLILYYCYFIERIEQKPSMKWTLTGLTLTEDEPKKIKKSKFLLSKRFKKQVASTHRRVMVYLNGQHTNCIEVVTDLKSMDDVSLLIFMCF